MTMDTLKHCTKVVVRVMNYGEKGDDADSDTDIYVHTYLSAATTADGVVIVGVAVVTAVVVVKGSLRLVPLLKSGCSVLRRPRVDTEYIAELVVVEVGPVVVVVVLAAATGLGL
jgi:hypothetical protein